MQTDTHPRPKKSLGQNFLTARRVVDDIIETANIGSNDIILEVGPGKGILTAELLKCAREVIAVEKDDQLAAYLTLKFREEIRNGKLKILNADILEFDPFLENLRDGGYKIVANIPYYITGEFLKRFLSEVNQPSKMVLMLQKEVVKRIASNDGKESILSISIKTYGRPKYIETVKAKLFRPAPRVDSAIILIDDISKNFFKNLEEEKFFTVVKTGFSQKRKKVSNNLAPLFGKEKISEILKNLGLNSNIRAEDIPLGKWKNIVQKLL